MHAIAIGMIIIGATSIVWHVTLWFCVRFVRCRSRGPAFHPIGWRGERLHCPECGAEWVPVVAPENTNGFIIWDRVK